MGLLTDNAASSYKASDLATIPLAIRVSAGGHRQKWRAICCHAGKNHFLGYYETAEAAKLAYDTFASRVFGEFFNSG